MKSLKIFATTSLVLTLAGCSRGVPQRQVELAINMSATEKLVSTLAVPPTPAKNWAARAIMSGEELQCFAIAVAGPAAENKSSCRTLSAKNISFTSLHGFHAKSSSVEIETPTGSGRKLYILGARMANGESCPTLADFSPRRSTQLRVLGEASLDVTNTEAPIRVPVNFDGEIIDECGGPALPPERKSIARCNLHRARVTATPGEFISNQIVVHLPREMPAVNDINQMRAIIPSAVAITREWKHMNSYLLTMPVGLTLVEQMDQLCALEHVSFVEPVEEIPVHSFSAPLTTPYAGSIVRIGHLDTGLTVGHSRFNGANLFESLEIPNGIDDDGDGFADNEYGMNWRAGTPGPVDDEGHGTAVSGAIAIGAGYDITDGGEWSTSSFKIIGEKFLDSHGKGNSFDAASAIEHARFMGAGLVLLPFGGAHDNILLRRAMVRASASNILLVSAVANNGVNEAVSPTYPANISVATNLAVGALNTAGDRASFSNFGGRVKVYASGQQILTTLYTNSLGYQSGTPLAAAQVAGLATRLSFVNPSLTAYELRNYLETNYAVKGLRTAAQHEADVVSAPQGLIPPIEFYPE